MHRTIRDGDGFALRPNDMRLRAIGGIGRPGEQQTHQTVERSLGHDRACATPGGFVSAAFWLRARD